MCWSRKRGEVVKGAEGREPKSVGEKVCTWVLGIWWRTKVQRQRKEAGTAGQRLWAAECLRRAESVP
jgi:hypothetical protein